MKAVLLVAPLLLLVAETLTDQSELTQGVMTTMFVIRLKIVAGMLTLSLLLGDTLADQTRALQPTQRAEPGSSNAKKPAVVISADQFDKLRALIKPRPGGFDDINWMTDLWEARKKAAAEGKPLLVWVGDGHPLGWT
jgi:hypothetical protein